MTQTEHSTQKHRDTYHHGDLHHALVAAGLELARSGGADAVVLREATRRTGVSPNAAYRHFDSREALLDEVAIAAGQRLAESMDEAVVRARGEFTNADAKVMATEVILAACRGYIDFALDEPGWFDVCKALSDRTVRVYYGGPDDGSVPADATAEQPARPATAHDVLQKVMELPEPLTWSTSLKTEDIELALRSALYGFSLLTTSGTLRLTDHAQQAGRLLSLIRACVSSAIAQ